MLSPFMKLAHDDDVGVAIRKIVPGTVVGDLTVHDEVPTGHKVALHPIAAGERVLKFGVPIGRATRDIDKGELVHTHNLTSDYLVNDVDHFEQ
jgi:altronate hydrolase